MINLKKDKKILGCFFNGERIVDILNHKGDSMLGFSKTFNYFISLKNSEEKDALYDEYQKNGINYYYFSDFDLKSKYPLDLEYMIKQDNLEVFDKTSPKFNFKLYHFLFQRYFLDTSLGRALYRNRYDEINNRWYEEEFTKEEIKTLFKINFDFDFEKVKTIITSFFNDSFYPMKTIFFLKSVHTQITENNKIKELVYDIFKNPDFYIEKFESVKSDRTEQINLNILQYGVVNPLYNRNTSEDVFVIKSSNENNSSYNNAEIHIANKTSNEVTLEVCYISSIVEHKEEFAVPANSNDYVVDIQSTDNKDLYFIRRKDGKLLNNKYHTNGWVKLF